MGKARGVGRPWEKLWGFQQSVGKGDFRQGSVEERG